VRPELSLLFRAAAAAVTLAALPACQPSQSNPANAEMPPEVSAVVVQPRDLPATFEYVGQIAGVREVEVRPRVSGILERWNYQEGAKIAAKSRNAIPALQVAAASAQFPPVMMEALKYSHLDNPWGYAFWDEFNQKAFIETTDAVALGRLAPTAAAQAIESLGNDLLQPH